MSAHVSAPQTSRISALLGAQLSLLLHRSWTEFQRAYQLAQRDETSRRNLRVLDDRMLADIGVSRAQAQFEANRAPWLR